jgi:hypothetical protein
VRLLLALLVLLLTALPTQAALSVVQKTTCSISGTTVCTTPGLTTTTGNLFVVNSSYCCAAFTSVTDSKSNSYTNSVAELTGGTSSKGRQDYVASGTGGGTHTWTLTGASGIYGTISVIEISGAAASPLDRTATGTDAGGFTHTTSSTATTTQANEVLVGAGGMAVNTTYSLASGSSAFTVQHNIATDASTEGIITATQIVSATGAYLFSYDSSASGSGSFALISTWKEATAAAGVRQRCVGCGVDGKVIE